ncbi:MAG: formate/nitrite transporter family protein [Oscillospiraceae bacterium]
MNKKEAETLVSSVMAGALIAFATVVNLLCDNKYYGSFLFAFGLVNVIAFKLDLITGIFGKLTTIPNKLKTSALVFAGNFIGTFIVGFCYRYVHTYKNIQEKVQASLSVKMGQGMLSLFIMGVLCGIFIGIAVWIQKTKVSDMTKLYVTILAVIFFILIGAEHCVANMTLIHLSGNYTLASLWFLVQNTIGNLAGGVLISLGGDYIIRKRHS